MKLKKNYVVRKIGTDYFAVAVSASARKQQTVKLNESGAFLFGLCREDFTQDSLTDALLANYDVTKEQADKDVAALIAAMRKNGLLDE